MHVVARLCLAAITAMIIAITPQPGGFVSAQVFTEPSKEKATGGRSKPGSSTTRRSRAARPARAEVAPAAPTAPAGFTDPQAYCEANPAATVPGEDYIGSIPSWLVSGWKVTSGNSQTQGPLAAQWKCSSGRVLACGTPIGENWCGQPQAINAPSEEMLAYCKANKKGAIPRYVTGNTTSVWLCNRRKPQMTGYRTDLDENGFLSDTWVDVTALSPAYMVGALSRGYVSNWQVPVSVGILGSLRKSGTLIVDGRTDELITTFSSMEIAGGDLGTVVGRNVYYGENAQGATGATGCIAVLILTEATPTSITVVERYRASQFRCRSPEIFMLQEAEGQLHVNWMRKGKSKPKRSEWVVAFQK
jgi:hypothetical protein